MNNLQVFNSLVMSSREIADLTGKQHQHVSRDIKNMLDNLALDESKFGHIYIDSQNREQSEFLLPKRECLILVSGYSIPLRAKIIDRWQELENKTNAIPQDYPSALRALADSEEQRMLAIATKAEIGSRREATAMNTASQQMKRANKLEMELDKAKTYASIKRMTMQYQGLRFKWQELKEVSKLMNLPPIDVFDQNYGKVKAYHKDVWYEVYALDVEMPEG